MSQNINFYTLPGMKDYLPINNKESKMIEENTGIKLTHHLLFCGSTNSGKSNSLLNFMYLCNGIFNKVVMCVQKLEPFNRYLKDLLKDDLMLLVGEDEIMQKLPRVSKLPDLSKDHDKYVLLVFDDCINVSKELKKMIKDYFTYGRSKGVQIAYLTQSYTDVAGATLSFIRKQCSYIILCGIKSNSELETILRNYNIGDIDVDALKKMYQYCKQKIDPNDINFMKITTYETEPDKKVSKNWLEYLNPSEFVVEKKVRRGRKQISIDISDDEKSE